MAEVDVELAIGRPANGLRPMVERYLGYRQSGVTLRVHRGLPSRNVTLIVSLADPIRIRRMPDPAQAPASLQALVGGMHVVPALIAQDPAQSGLHVELNPLGVRALLGVSAEELSSQVIELSALPGNWMRALPDRLFEADTWQRRFAILDQVLGVACDDNAVVAPEVGHAWQRILASAGDVSVTGLATEVGWSRHHLTKRFSHAFGLSPKQAARVIRFERSCELLRTLPGVKLADLAARCGYYDQAHLTNEWNVLAGCTPSTWIAEELPFLQDGQDGVTAA